MNSANLEKNVIKYYMKAKEHSSNREKYYNYLVKTLKYIKNIDSSKLELLESRYLNKIKKYCNQNIEKYFSESMIKFNKKADVKVFDYINQGDINSINDTENIYNYQIYDDEGLTPLHRCINLGDTSILKEFLKRGESIDTVNKNGNTLLEYACLQNDPNLITFILGHGGDMKKHLFFREKFKLKLNLDDIDLAILIKLCLKNGNKHKLEEDIDFLMDFIDADYEIGIADIKFCQFLEFLKATLSKLSKESINSIIEIWKEELIYTLENKLGCPENHFELILINLVPFINYPFNLSNRNYLTREVINLVKKLGIENNFQIDNDIAIKLIDIIWVDYKDILPVDYLGIILNNILIKLKVK